MSGSAVSAVMELDCSSVHHCIQRVLLPIDRAPHCMISLQSPRHGIPHDCDYWITVTDGE